MSRPKLKGFVFITQYKNDLMFSNCFLESNIFMQVKDAVTVIHL